MGGNLSKERSTMEGNVHEGGLEIRRTEHLARAAADPTRPCSAHQRMGGRRIAYPLRATTAARPSFFFQFSQPPQARPPRQATIQ